MQAEAQNAVWIRGPQLRKRWGDMPASTFYLRLQRGLIPKPEYPFGPSTPYWRMQVVEAHERRSLLSLGVVQKSNEDVS